MSFVEFNKVNAIEHLFTLLRQVQLWLTSGGKESVLEPSNFKYTARAKGEGREGGSDQTHRRAKKCACWAPVFILIGTLTRYVVVEYGEAEARIVELVTSGAQQPKSIMLAAPNVLLIIKKVETDT